MYRATTSFTTKNYDVKKNQILADNFTTQDEIEDLLEVGHIVVYEDTLEIVQNGLYDVDEYINANVNVSGGEPNLQSKSVTITENGTTNVQADTGYDGLSGVEVVTNVEGSFAVPDGMKFSHSTSSQFPTDNLNFDNVTDFSYMFSSNTSLLVSPNVNSSNGTNFSNMYSYCEKMTTYSSIDTSKATDMSYMFYTCKKLTGVSNINTSKANDLRYLCGGCSELVDFPIISLENVSTQYNFAWIVGGCPKLSDESLNNVLASAITLPSKITLNKTLKTLGLSQTQATRCQSLSNYQAFLDAGWTTGY